MATVVAKLFGQARPQRAYFGEKDWQQLQVVRRLAADLLLPVEVVGVATRRDPDGLAMSSRNRFLSAAEREQAPLLPLALREAAGSIVALLRASAQDGPDPGGEGPPAASPVPQPTARPDRDVEAVLDEAKATLARTGFAVDYLALVEAGSLREVRDLAPTPVGALRLIVAARLGTVRLLDNLDVPAV